MCAAEERPADHRGNTAGSSVTSFVRSFRDTSRLHCGVAVLSWQHTVLPADRNQLIPILYDAGIEAPEDR